MQKLRVFSKSKDSPSTSPTNSNPSTPKLRDFSFNQHSPITTSESTGRLSPEMAPIVTLLSAQSHRKYVEGLFMLLKDLDSDGNPADRKWCEVYGIMIGNELAYWNSDSLDSAKNLNSLNDVKPSFLNFSDGTFNPSLNLKTSNGSIENVIVLSTTLKNRFLLQFNSKIDFISWYSAFRLSTFEYKTLQEAYTASLLSARGSLLSDIKVILFADKKFKHEDWTSVRFGAGMPWKRCFAVIEPGKFSKNNFKNGTVYFYENEKKSKKQLMAKIVSITSIYALYPRSYTVIDQSTLIKLEGSIQFDNKDNVKSCSIFLMPEQHTSVPGYDTLIRFIIPLMDAFNLYGRPKKLNADKKDPNSLLFALPVLPNVHYLKLDDLKLINENPNSLDWDQIQWDSQIKSLLKKKLDNGYTGCGSVHGEIGARDLISLSKDMASGKIRYFVNNPEAQKYLQQSPHTKRHSSSTTTTTDTSKSDNHVQVQVQPSPPPPPPPQQQQKQLHPSLTPTHDNVIVKNSPSPQPLNIYQRYAQLPENDFKGITASLKKTSLETTADDLYPTEGRNSDEEDEEEDDDDDDDSAFNFITPQRKQFDDQRIVSPFTEFNNNYRKAVQPSQSHRQSPPHPPPAESHRQTPPLHPPPTNINMRKQRSHQQQSQQQQQLHPQQHRAPSDNIVSQRPQFDAPPTNPYIENSPHTPLEQQRPPQLPPHQRHNQQWDSQDSPNFYHRQPPHPQNYKYTNSPELVPPHQFRPNNYNQQQQQPPPPPPQQQQQQQLHPLVTNSPSFGNYGPMKLPSPVINNQQTFYPPQQQPVRPHMPGPQQQGYNGYGYTRGPPPRNVSNPRQRGPPPPQQLNPQQHQQQSQQQSRSFKHDPYAIARGPT
ncbi:hypothetical protein CANINC_001474 [Pichia inconspicua]|uniref:Skg3/CAF120-like PH-like domain-containing protein n=1 Tax=Pichia inconspicua TaxID=52247 RepID=A0A4T0X418_9ASCO|nr:hypothetical protein CANINC_001474 [[Candida] inconspicua]